MARGPTDLALLHAAGGFAHRRDTDPMPRLCPHRPAQPMSFFALFMKAAITLAGIWSEGGPYPRPGSPMDRTSHRPGIVRLILAEHS